MTPEDIIKNISTSMIEELQTQRDDAYAALDSANVALKELRQKLEVAKSEVKLHRDEINYWSKKWKEQENTRKEPSRLEIAAMLFSKSSNPFSDDSMHIDEAFRYADALIAANMRAK